MARRFINGGTLGFIYLLATFSLIISTPGNAYKPLARDPFLT